MCGYMGIYGMDKSVKTILQNQKESALAFICPISQMEFLRKLFGQTSFIRVLLHFDKISSTNTNIRIEELGHVAPCDIVFQWNKRSQTTKIVHLAMASWDLSQVCCMSSLNA